MFICVSVECIELTRNRVIYRGEWDPLQIDPGELRYATILLYASRMHNRCLKCREILKQLGYTPEKASKEAFKILSKGSRGDRVVLDPVFPSLVHWLVSTKSVKNVPWWWCAGLSRGKFFTTELGAEPYIYDEDTGGYRWREALNPWSLSEPSDLDTIIGAKEGTVGRSPWSIEVTKYDHGFYTRATFYGASDTTIRSILFLCCSQLNEGWVRETTPTSPYPAPPGTCHSDYVSSVYLPLYGFEVDIPISADTPYGLTVHVYTTFP